MKITIRDRKYGPKKQTVSLQDTIETFIWNEFENENKIKQPTEISVIFYWHNANNVMKAFKIFSLKCHLADQTTSPSAIRVFLFFHNGGTEAKSSLMCCSFLSNTDVVDLSFWYDWTIYTKINSPLYFVFNHRSNQKFLLFIIKHQADWFFWTVADFMLQNKIRFEEM